MTEKSPVVLKAHFDPNSPQAREFFYWLGVCVAAWAYIDRRLYQIFHHATGFEQQQQSALIFYGNRAFNQRLRLVDDALRLMLSKDIRDRFWKPLRDRTDELSQTRNVFAHHPTKRLRYSKDGLPQEVFSVFIEPYERILNRDYPGLRDKEELTLEDLIQHEKDVRELEAQLDDFAWHAGGERAVRKTRSARDSLSE